MLLAPKQKPHTHRQRSVDKHAPVAYGTAVPHGRLSIGPDGTIMVTRAAYTHPLTQKHTHTDQGGRTAVMARGRVQAYLPDVFMATHVDFLELLRVGRTEILSHLDRDVLGQHGKQQPLLKRKRVRE